MKTGTGAFRPIPWLNGRGSSAHTALSQRRRAKVWSTCVGWRLVCARRSTCHSLHVWKQQREIYTYHSPQEALEITTFTAPHHSPPAQLQNRPRQYNKSTEHLSERKKEPKSASESRPRFWLPLYVLKAWTRQPRTLFPALTTAAKISNKNWRCCLLVIVADSTYPPRQRIAGSDAASFSSRGKRQRTVRSAL